MNRRNFLTKTSYTLGAGTLLASIGCKTDAPVELDEWQAIRSQFLLSNDQIQMAQFLMASHPTSVREAIEKHRKGLDINPALYIHEHYRPYEGQKVPEAAAKYLEAKGGEIAITGSTTMGLGLLYTGFKLEEGDDVLTSTHGHYSTLKSLDFAAERSGASLRKEALYQDPFQVSVDEVLNNLKNAILSNTKLVAVTYVHSSTGVKMPIKEMAAVIKEINANRDEADRVYFAVDTVHGFGVEDITVGELGCDFLVAGTHKWLFGPRGTGILWAKEDAWDMVNPTIPPFSIAYGMWQGTAPEAPLDFRSKVSPGGFHSFDHRWALKEAFEWHLEVGKEKIQDRTHQLNTLLKKGIAEIPHVKLHTPISTDLSSGINCFEVAGIEPDKVIEKLFANNIVGSTSPYRTVYARLTPCILNTEEEVMDCIKVLENMKA